MRLAEDQGVLGLHAWFALIEALDRIGRGVVREPIPVQDELWVTFGRFLQALEEAETPDDAAVRARVYPVVFVSHQRNDLAEAERIAWLACAHGVDYWLDIHDPLLIIANQRIPPGDPRHAIIIAAIVEMALLNSTHLVAVQTKNSLLSKWVPYELGRARDRNIWSRNAGGWFHPRVRPDQFGDYVQLCRIAHGGEGDLNQWFGQWSPGRRLSWWRGQTTPLP